MVRSLRRDADRKMNVAIGPFAIAAALLIVGGVAKAVRPGDTARALSLAGVPVPAQLVQVSGALEAGLGAWALFSADRLPAALVAASYFGFSVFVAVAMARRLPIASCGCFGRVDTPPSTVHLAIDAAAVAVAIAVVSDPGDGLRLVLENQPALGVPFAVLVVAGTAAALVALTALPRALGGQARDSG